jgi:hypothetical protein
MSQEWASWTDWCGAHTWTWQAIEKQISSAISTAVWQEYTPLVVNKVPEKEREETWQGIKRRVFLQTVKAQADVFREFLGNPYRPRNSQDFRG